MPKGPSDACSGWNGGGTSRNFAPSSPGQELLDLVFVFLGIKGAGGIYQPPALFYITRGGGQNLRLQHAEGGQLSQRL